jgi:hypothetical protein
LVSRESVAFAALLTVMLATGFLITNASFYWLGERVAAPTWDGWIANFARWHWPFVRVPLIFAGLVLLVRLLIRRGGVVSSATSTGKDSAAS